MASTGSVTTGVATAQPSNKVLAAGFAGALTTIFIFAVNNYLLVGKQQITPEIAAALTTVLSALLAYLVPPSDRESVVP